MITPFSKKLTMLAGLELLLAAVVLSSAFVVVGTFLVVAPPHPSTVRGQDGAALVAHLAFAMSLLLPAGIMGVHRFDRAEALRSFLQRFLLSIGVGLLLCYALLALVPTLGQYRDAIPPAAALGALGLVGVRLLLVPRLQMIQLQHRVLILGTAGEAALVAQALARLAGGGLARAPASRRGKGAVGS